MITAEELINKKYLDFESLDNGNIWTNIEELMQQFAKLHVQEALKQASEKSLMKDVNEDCHYEDEEGNFPEIYFIDKDSILNAYNLNNIK